jgi:hypothetical protein
MDGNHRPVRCVVGVVVVLLVGAAGCSSPSQTETDAVAMTEQQLDTVAGGAGYIKFDGVQGGVLRLDKSSPKSRFRGCVPMDN